MSGVTSQPSTVSPHVADTDLRLLTTESPSPDHRFLSDFNSAMKLLREKDEMNVPIALSAFRDGDQGPSKVTKTEL